VRVIFAGAFVVASLAAASGAAGPQKKSTGGAIMLPWAQVPVCLDATIADEGDRKAEPITWTSTRHDVRTPKGTIGVQPQSDAVVLTLGGQPVSLGADVEGKTMTLGDWSLKVWGVPDCASPLYLFISQTSDGNPVRRRQWLFDPGREVQAGRPAVIYFPDAFGTDTVVIVRDNALTVTSGAAEGTEKTLRYFPDPVGAFVRPGAQQKYMRAIGTPNRVFYENAAATDVLRKTAGDEIFDTLRTRSSAGTTELVEGRYLVVAGSAAGDFARHAAVVVDIVKDVAVFLVCEDDQIESGALVAASRADLRTLERGGDEVLAAFRTAGFSLIWDERGRLACDGECHGER
jgi:hypothetical protein